MSDQEREDSFLQDAERSFPERDPSDILRNSQVPIVNAHGQINTHNNEYELAAKNKVIDSLQTKVKSLETQLQRQHSNMSGRSSRSSMDTVDGHMGPRNTSSSPTNPRSPSHLPHTQNNLGQLNGVLLGDDPAALPLFVQQRESTEGSVKSRQLSVHGDRDFVLNDVVTDTVVHSSNSTDSDKLAQGGNYLTQVIELQSKVNEQQHEISQHVQQIREVRDYNVELEKQVKKLHDLKDTWEAEYKKMELKWTSDREALEQLKSDRISLLHQLEQERKHRQEVEIENEQIRKNELRWKTKIKETEHVNVTLTREMEKVKRISRTGPLGDSMVMSQEGSSNEEEESQRLVQMVQQLITELEETAKTVRLQSALIRKLKAKSRGSMTESDHAWSEYMGEGAKPKVIRHGRAQQQSTIRHPVACEEDVTKSFMEISVETPSSPAHRSRSPHMPTEHVERLSSQSSQLGEVAYRARSGEFSPQVDRSQASVPVYPPTISQGGNSSTLMNTNQNPMSSPTPLPMGQSHLAKRLPTLNQEHSEEDIYGSDSPPARQRPVTTPVLSSNRHVPPTRTSFTQPLNRPRPSSQPISQSVTGPIDLDSLSHSDLPSQTNNIRLQPEGSSSQHMAMSLSAPPRALNYERNLPDQKLRRSYDNTHNNLNITPTITQEKVSSTNRNLQTSNLTKPVPSQNVYQAETAKQPPKDQWSSAPAAVQRQQAALEQSDADSIIEMVCPICSQMQPAGTSFDDFQLHVLGCMGESDQQQLQSPPAREISDGGDKVCPVCNRLFPFTVSHNEFEEHVNDHFESDFTILDRGNFGEPSNS